MGQSTLELADVVRAHAESFFAERGAAASPAQRRVLHAIAACRTAELGAHVRRCDQCGHRDVAYNSCRNRHCPKCMGSKRAQWLAAREKDLLPVEYFHVVFTIPPEIAQVARQNKRVVYDALLRSSAETVLQIARDPRHLGANVGLLSVLHTWGQRLNHHPHVHCVVPGGGLAIDGSGWRSCPRGFFLPVRVLSPVFRGKFIDMLKAAHARGDLRFQGQQAHLSGGTAFHSLLKRAYRQDWVVYAKPPFGGPVQVLKYLARYTHRAAISNRRLLHMEDGRVTIAWKDYARRNRWRRLHLDATELLRRFCQHVLPKGFQRIRHYGLFAGRNRNAKLARCRQFLTAHGDAPTEQDPDEDTCVADPLEPEPTCPHCSEGKLLWIETLPRFSRACSLLNSS